MRQPSPHKERLIDCVMRVTAVRMNSFAEAFLAGASGCIGTCECGLTFYAPNGSWDWVDGELERYQTDPKKYIAVDVDSVCHVEFRGHSYVVDCTCWHDAANEYIVTITHDRAAIARFFALERARMKRLAESFPEIQP